MNAERLARLLVCAVLLGLPAAVFGVPRLAPAPGARVIAVHGAVAEDGGWTPQSFAVGAGETVHLSLTSDDVVHGFAVGQSDLPAVDVQPGQTTGLDVRFEQPGTYTFYCTRWCGPNHWRMRGTIEVTGPGPTREPARAPLYVTLGLNLDAPHPAAAVPDARPSAARGAALGVAVPAPYRTLDYTRAHSPAAIWTDLRAAPFTVNLSDAQVWDLTAWVVAANAAPGDWGEAAELFAANCAACHGENGRGDGVMAASRLPADAGMGHEVSAPADFTNPTTMLGASSALLQGKLVRGGMGTGMPYWGPILTEAQTWALVHYVQAFTLDLRP